MAYDPLDPMQELAYDDQVRRLRESYQRQLARQDYERNYYTSQNAAQRDALAQQFFNARQRVPYSYSGRGLLSSGLYKKAITDYLDNRNKSFADFDITSQYRQGQFDLSRLDLEQTLQGGISAIEAERQAARARNAAALREVM